MDDIGLTIDYEDGLHSIGAPKILKAARLMHDLLRAIEKAHTKKPPKILWDVTIYSMPGRAHIGFSATVRADKALVRSIAEAAQANPPDVPDR